MHTIPRRSALLGLTAVVTAGGASMALAAAPTERRFIVVILRGAMDGLSVVVPHGDPDLMTLRPGLVPPAVGMPDGLLDLGGGFALHPAMTGCHAMFQAHELAPVHAVAGNYRVRSHFEAQDCLESGADHRMTSGWLNRVAGVLPAVPAGRPMVQTPSPRGVPGPTLTQVSTPGPRGDDGLSHAIAIGNSVPLLLRGPIPVANWAPHGGGEPNQDLFRTILALNQKDALMGPAIAAGLRDRGFGDEATRDGPKDGTRFGFPGLARAAGEMLKAPGGPRLAAFELGGWDTHTAQMGRLNGPLKALDAGLLALKTEMGETWRQTAVLVMTEFGRTARMNGTNGTDHGTATVAFVAGGAVAGGRVVANWPGLKPGQLFENRDLAPTTDLRAVAKGILAGHFGLNPAALARVFPGAETLQPVNGLIRAA